MGVAYVCVTRCNFADAIERLSICLYHGSRAGGRGLSLATQATLLYLMEMSPP